MKAVTVDIGDKVFVVNWGKKYSHSPSVKKWFSSDIPQYSEDTFFWETQYEELTRAGKPYKRKWERPVKARIPKWENFKYEVVEIVSHPETEELVCLLSSEEGCWIIIGIEGIHYLTPEQYKNAEFDALKEFHKGKWTIDMRTKAQESFPKNLIGIVYDKNDSVLFGSSMTKGKVQYNYIPAEYMDTGRPFIISVSVLYDGKGNSDLPENTLFMNYRDLPKMFPDNIFSH